MSPNLHAIIGSDEARVAEAALALAEKLTPADAGEFGTEIINGVADNADHAAKTVSETIQAIQTLPFFGGVKVVWLKNANFFTDSVTGNAAATQEAIENLTALLKEGIPEGVHFLLSASGMDKRRAFYKTLNKLTKIAVFDRLDTSRPGWESDVMGLVAQRAKKYRLSFDREALEFFVMLAGEDSRQIDAELEKLDLYLGPGGNGNGEGPREITSEHVRKLVAQSRAGIVFEIGDAIGKRRLRLALERVDQLIYHGESAIGILLAAVVPKVRSLLLAKDLLERHHIRARNYRGFEGELNRLPDTETAHLPRKKDGGISCYPIYLASQECGRFKLARLRRGLEECLDANVRLVTTQLDSKLVLEQLLIRLLT